MSLGGWVLLHRQIMDSALWKTSGDVYKLASACLMLANWEPRSVILHNGSQQILGRGQFLTSLQSLSRDTGLTIKQVRTGLKRLSSPPVSFLEQITTRNYRIITICNYEKYQDTKNPEGKPKGKPNDVKRANRRATTKEDINNSGKNTNNKEDFSCEKLEAEEIREEDVKTLDDYDKWYGQWLIKQGVSS